MLAEVEKNQKELNSQMLDEGVWNIKLDKGEPISLGVLSWHIGSNKLGNIYFLI